MNTGSTKQRLKSRPASGPISRAKAVEKIASQPDRANLSERAWLITSLAILAIGAILRLYNLNLVPLHHDEGVNGNFLVRLVREGVYHYDPANYHGPTLYYFAAIVPWILRFLFGAGVQNTYGLNTVTIRLVPALFGVATIWLVLLLRRRLGTIATLSAAGLLALSPGSVYLSRYFIHETLFVFFTVGLVVAGLKYYEDGHPVYLILAAASAALLFATKETAIISAGVLVLAFAATHLYRRLLRGQKREKEKPRALDRGKKPPTLEFLENVGGTRGLLIWGLVALTVFIGVNVLFYSSFFTNYPKGVADALKTFQFWTKTGKEAHVHPFLTYIWWLLRQESPLLFLGSLGAALLLANPRNSFALFSALWGFGLIAAYSLIAYKTPWLTLNFMVPLALTSGYALQTIYEEWLPDLRLLGTVGVLAVAISGYQTVDLNFSNYDNDDPYYVYVYAHTRRETLKLVDEINRLAEQSKEGKLTGVTIVSPDYWPLPWYLRDYTRVGYFGRMVDSSEQIIVASESQGAEMQQRFGGRYEQVPSGFNDAGSFPLRPGVSLLLYVRRNQPINTSISSYQRPQMSYLILQTISMFDRSTVAKLN